MNDIIERIGTSLIQHGKSSNRVYLMKLCRSDYPEILHKIYNLAKENNYTKIFVKIPAWAQPEFEQDGYTTEAHIPNFYKGEEDAFFMARFLDAHREKQESAALIEEIIAFTKKMQSNQLAAELDEKYSIDILTSKDAEHMAAVYKTVFETYPFPIHNPVYLLETMRDNIVYFGIWKNEKLIALSSCEMDEQSKNVEMTDFATLPEYRSQGFASFLLGKMEPEMKKRGIKTAYTIARAVSYGMNITFAKHNYIYTGTLTNNTNISGEIESMNVWYKSL